MYAWTAEHAAEERKPTDTEQQFLYKARKKAIGPFKKQLWSLEPSVRDAIGASLEQRFAFLMAQLNDRRHQAGRGQARRRCRTCHA